MPIRLPGKVPRDAHWVSPRGTNDSPGTRARPWRTLPRALRSLRPGDTLVVKPGTYGSVGATTVVSRGGTPSKRITIRGAPGRKLPRVVGAFRIAVSNVRVDRLLFDGPTGRVQHVSSANPGGEQVQVAIYDGEGGIRNVSISRSEVRDSKWHAGIYVAAAQNVRIVGNRIHHNGDETSAAQSNVSHGVYWASGSGLIANNLVSQNVARGVQLFPYARQVTVTQNTIVGNGRAGVQVGEQASYNWIVNNIIAWNGDHGIRSSSLTGSNNRANRNLLWGNGGGPFQPDDGLTIRSSKMANPRLGKAQKPRRRSPAIDHAARIGSVSLDRRGRKRPRGKGPDLGAYEVR